VKISEESAGNIRSLGFWHDFIALLSLLLQGDHSWGTESFRKLYGDGAFHPGEVRDEQLGVEPGLTNYQAVIDVVTFIDGTAEATNNDALGRIVDEPPSHGSFTENNH
jgi:hypothetical protein